MKIASVLFVTRKFIMKSLILIALLASFVTYAQAQSTTTCEDSDGRIVCRTVPDRQDPFGLFNMAPIGLPPAIIDFGAEERRMQEFQRSMIELERTQRERQLHIQRLNATLPEWQTGYFHQVDKNAKVPNGTKRCMYRNDGGLIISGQLYNGFNIDIPSNENCFPRYQVSKSGQYRPPVR